MGETKKKNKKMTEKEKKDWKELCDYIKIIFGYDENMKFPKYMALRLKGLAEGKHMANNNIQNEANYGFDTILLTFKVKRMNIDYALKTKNFKDEKHKINYVMTIIDSSINDVYLKQLNNKTQEKKSEIIATNVIEVNSNKAEYKKRTKECIDELNDLW